MVAGCGNSKLESANVPGTQPNPESESESINHSSSEGRRMGARRGAWPDPIDPCAAEDPSGVPFNSVARVEIRAPAGQAFRRRAEWPNRLVAEAVNESQIGKQAGSSSGVSDLDFGDNDNGPAGAIPTTQGDDGIAARDDVSSCIGLVSESTITTSRRASGKTFPRLRISVTLHVGKPSVGFRARIDTGCELNLITERVALRLADVESLPDSPEVSIIQLTGTEARTIKKMKIGFSVLGFRKKFKDIFYVVASEGHKEPYDAILGQNFVITEGLLTPCEEISQLWQKAVRVGRGSTNRQRDNPCRLC